MVSHRVFSRRSRITAAAAGVLGLLWLSAESVAAAGASEAQRLDGYVTASARPLESQARDALSAIESPPRRLLALRAYLRAGDSLGSRWSWSTDEIASYTATAEHGQLLAAIAQVQARFAADNPGYSLYANTDVRSFEVQLERWNSNPSVGKVAQQLHSAALRELARNRYPLQPGEQDIERFSRFLHEWRPTVAAPLAAPGLSKHGRLRAIDFQIMRDGRVVAPTQMDKVAPIWAAQGWTRKLQAATEGSGFVGPLRSPDEPWHYEYVPRKSVPEGRHAIEAVKNGTGTRVEAAKR